MNEQEKDHSAELAAVGNDTERSATETASELAQWWSQCRRAYDLRTGSNRLEYALRRLVSAAQSEVGSNALELKYRRELWLNHGHSGAALYGDDGQMQCSACMGISRLYDYRHAPLADVEAAAHTARTLTIAKALAGNPASTEVSSTPAASPAPK